MRLKSETRPDRELLQVWVSATTHEAVRAHAKSLGVPMTELVRVALPLGLRQLQQPAVREASRG